MSYHPRRILTPGPTRKRREREPSFYSSPLKPSAQSPAHQAAAKAKPAQAHQAATAKRSFDEPALSNQLLAGYMAYEFLTKGTLFGQKFDPARAEAVPVGGVAEAKRSKQLEAAAEPSGSEEEEEENNNNNNNKHKKKKKEKKEAKEHESYAEVASILKSPGAHIPGIVNPTQLARWIQM